MRTTFPSAGSLALEVRDATGAVVRPGPPPMPPAGGGGPSEWRTLAPGEAMTFACGAAIAIDAPPGRDEVRFRGVPADDANGSVTSPWAPFTIAP